MKTITAIILALSLIKVLELEYRVHKLEKAAEQLRYRLDDVESLSVATDDRLDTVSKDVDKLIENA